LISESIFDAYLHCPRKAHFLSSSATTPDVRHQISDWQRQSAEKYQKGCQSDLLSRHAGGCFVGTPRQQELKTATHEFILRPIIAAQGVKSHIDALQRAPIPTQNGRLLYTPVRFCCAERVTRHHKLTVAFDALVLKKALGQMPTRGKIIHGLQRTTVGLKVDGLIREVESQLAKLRSVLAANSAPEPVLCRHCPECEFEDECRKRAAERDDLSLLDGLAFKDRAKLNAKGIFTVTQLAFTFRPRRRGRRQASRREKYQHALKALAVRDRKVHVVGKPELKIEGTPVFLDVEGMPDRDFYYLIGLRIPDGASHRQLSLWADSNDNEEDIWRSFLSAVQEVDRPVLIHYGSYETKFMKRLASRYPNAISDSSFVEKLLGGAVNLLGITYSQIYFPTYSNRLKEVAQYLGFRWSALSASGLHALMWRQQWEECHDDSLKSRLIAYNREDCEALEVVAHAVGEAARLAAGGQPLGCDQAENICVHTEDAEKGNKWRRFASPIPALEEINNAAHWDYQRDRIYVRNPGWRRTPSDRRSAVRREGKPRLNKVVACSAPVRCPNCGRKKLEECPQRSKVVVDLRIGRTGVKRWAVKYLFHDYACLRCGEQISSPQRTWGRGKYGWGLVSFLVYEIVGLSIPQRVVTQQVNRLFGLSLPRSSVGEQKTMAARRYVSTRDALLAKIVAGQLVHVDETPIVTKGKRAYVWVFCNFNEVVYAYSESREAKFMHETLAGFNGVLVSDFYSAYDSVECLQQKCLIHLIRDLNDEMLKHPYDDELRKIVQQFGELLRLIVATVDRFRLKKRFLHRHVADVQRFYRWLSKCSRQGEAAAKCAERLERNREKLFTFLRHDGVPWNNNNAEHAMKGFAALREVIEGTTTADGIQEYLVLLSIAETCKYKGIDFLQFLLSGETDIDTVLPSGVCRKG
jgi:predicted RecB family nuclease